MALDPFLQEVLVDPTDHEGLLYFESRHLLYNPRTRTVFEVKGSIPVLLPNEGRAVEESEHAELVADSSGVLTGTPPS